MSYTAPNPKPRKLPLGTALRPTIERMRAIAAEASEALLTEGPVHPDHTLLDLCSEALHLFKQSAALSAARPMKNRRPDQALTQGDRDRDAALLWEIAGLNTQAKRRLHSIKKLRATTPAGIYGKALVIRSMKTGSYELAASLADDLIACPAVRASIWPAAPAGEA